MVNFIKFFLRLMPLKTSNIYLWKKVVWFVCHIEISQTMVCLVMLLVSLEIFQWIKVYQIGFIMFQLIVKKSLKTNFSWKFIWIKQIIMEFGPLLVFLQNFGFIGFNEGVWICKSPMICEKYWILNNFFYSKFNYITKTCD
jgi:hypothetical protein